MEQIKRTFLLLHFKNFRSLQHIYFSFEYCHNYVDVHQTEEMEFAVWLHYDYELI
jgi:hypothetical protein